MSFTTISGHDLLQPKARKTARQGTACHTNIYLVVSLVSISTDGLIQGVQAGQSPELLVDVYQAWNLLH